MTTPRILGSDDEQDDNTSLSSNDDFSSNNSQVRPNKINWLSHSWMSELPDKLAAAIWSL